MWFIISKKNTLGPFSTDELLSLHKNGLIESEQLVWSRTSPKWTLFSDWLRQAENKKLTLQSNTNTWYYAYKGQSYGPLKQTELITQLKNIKQIKLVLLWTQGMKSWSSIYDFHNILDEVGVNARQYPRAEIEGTLIFTLQNRHYEMPITSISEGGIGIIDMEILKSGNTLLSEIHSDSLPQSLSVNLQVVYRKSNGFVGLKFLSINNSQINIIKDYVYRKTQDQHQPLRFAA